MGAITREPLILLRLVAGLVLTATLVLKLARLVWLAWSTRTTKNASVTTKATTEVVSLEAMALAQSAGVLSFALLLMPWLTVLALERLSSAIPGARCAFAVTERSADIGLSLGIGYGGTALALLTSALAYYVRFRNDDRVLRTLVWLFGAITLLAISEHFFLVRGLLTIQLDTPSSCCSALGAATSISASPDAAENNHIGWLLPALLLVLTLVTALGATRLKGPWGWATLYLCVATLALFPDYLSQWLAPYTVLSSFHRCLYCAFNHGPFAHLSSLILIVAFQQGLVFSLMSLMGTDEGAVPLTDATDGPSATHQLFASAKRGAGKRASILFALAAACLVYPIVRFFVENGVFL